MIANLVRPVFSFCRDVQIWIKLRSEMFPDERGHQGGTWKSPSLAQFFGLNTLTYSQDVRDLIMGSGDSFKPTGNAFSRFCGV